MVPLYTDPVRVARINDEIPQYRESKRANIACKKAIENLLAERFDGLRLHGDCAKELCDEFGADRVGWVLACTVQHFSWDGRFRHQNKLWADEFLIPTDPDDRTTDYTYNSYHSMIYGKIRRYFERRDLTVGTVKPKDIEGFYDSLFDEGVVANTVIHYHAVLRKAFQQAFKDELIDANPFDRVDRPKKNKFQGENYSEEELLALLKLTKDDPIYPAIMLAGGLGLRRSEALGVRWSRINFEERYVLLDTKIVESKDEGGKFIRAVEEMKIFGDTGSLIAS